MQGSAHVISVGPCSCSFSESGGIASSSSSFVPFTPSFSRQTARWPGAAVTQRMKYPFPPTEASNASAPRRPGHRSGVSINNCTSGGRPGLLHLRLCAVGSFLGPCLLWIAEHQNRAGTALRAAETALRATETALRAAETALRAAETALRAAETALRAAETALLRAAETALRAQLPGGPATPREVRRRSRENLISTTGGCRSNLSKVSHCA
jgi:hypothetical protein